MRTYLYATVFITGMTTLAVEFAASRLLGNYFGASNLVWASIVGLILIYLTVGYFLGGRWADRSPEYGTFFKILCWGSFAVGLVPVIARPILSIASRAFDALQVGVMAGSFIVVLILFSVPITLLGTASPFAIRLAITDPRTVGVTSGRVYAISTLGSFIGTFLPVLILIPWLGTFRTFLFFSLITLITALIGLAMTKNQRAALTLVWMPVVIIILFVIGFPGTDKPTEGLVYETESAYNYIQVVQSGEFTYLRLNEGQGIHSIYHPTQIDFKGPWDMAVAAPFFNPPPISPDQITSMAIVGLAAGTTARQATAVYGPDLMIDGIEIDPTIIEVARTYFNMTEPNLNVITEDGRWALAHSANSYQIISVDAYRPPYIPWHLTTQEFFQTARDHLTSDGVLVINVGRTPDDRRMVSALYSTLASVFPSVFVVDLPLTFNTMIYATMQPTHIDNLIINLGLMEKEENIHPLLLRTMRTALENLQLEPEPGIVFTDDKAPVEGITNAIVIDFFLSGQTELIQ